MGLVPGAFDAKLDAINARLFVHRATRPQPRTDDKVLAAWNGLMIAACADAGEILREPRYIAAAERASAFLLREMRFSSGRLVRSWRGTAGKAPAVLEDYSCVIGGLLALARVNPTSAAAHRTHAKNLLEIVEADFALPSGAVMDAARDSGDLFVRLRSSHDGATPSAVSVLLHSLIDLGEAHDDEAPTRRAGEILASIAGRIVQSPVSTINSTRALLRLLLRGEIPEADPGEAERAPDPAPRHDHPDFTPVEIYADVDRITVTPDAPATLTLFVRIATGYHVIAADPGEGLPGLLPFRVGIVHGQGVAAYADYPSGTPFGVPEAGRVNVYAGEFELPIVVDLEGELTGTPLLSVTYQACSNTECLNPRTVEIDVAIDRG
jgi:hypothetical protein